VRPLAMLLVFSTFTAMAWAQAPAAQPGDATHSLQVGGRTRSYLLHLPPAVMHRQALPLVIVLHGGGGSARNAARMTNMSAKADRERFAAIYPNGTGMLGQTLLTWNAGNCCGYAQNQSVDDVGFLRALIDRGVGEGLVDRRRVFVTGISNGGMMSYRAACELADKIAAIGPVAGAQNIECRPSDQVALIVFHGTDDQHVLYEGGPTRRGIAGPRVDRSVPYAVTFWARHNECEAVPERNERGNVVHETYRRCRNGTGVVLYAIKGGGHAWPGGTPGLSLGGRAGDEPTQELSATDLMWDFFAAHPKRR
jgi:polyhydroxybutyrate depolymerase